MHSLRFSVTRSSCSKSIPRASRTIPYVSKAVGAPLARVAALCMVGKSLAEQAVRICADLPFYAVKEAVFPFLKLPGVDPILGPEMKSTGEVMGIGKNFGDAFDKAQRGAGMLVPRAGTAFISVRDRDKDVAVNIARRLHVAGFKLVATGGTARAIDAEGIPCERINKVLEGQPHVVDLIKNDGVDLIVNTTEGKQSTADSYEIRRNALFKKVAYTTTMAGADAILQAIENAQAIEVRSVQEIHASLHQH